MNTTDMHVKQRTNINSMVFLINIQTDKAVEARSELATSTSM